MSDMAPNAEDPYARADYRRLIAWEARIRREGPFLTELLERAPDRSVLDLGCGTGEHTAFFARQGVRAVGIDHSESMIDMAREYESRGEGRFVLADAVEAPALLEKEPPFGLVLCLGNMIPHVTEDAELDALLRAAHDLLLPGVLFLIQILNYRRIIDQEVRHLPLNFREGDDGEEIVFLRLLQPVSERRILFFPTTLTLTTDDAEPVAVKRSRRVELRPWTASDLAPALERAGFDVEIHGDMNGGAFDAAESNDLVAIATRKPDDREASRGG